MARMIFLTIERIVSRAVAAALFVSGVCLALLAMCCFYQVLSRFALNAPVDWSESLARMLMIWVVFLGIPAAFQQGAMMSMELLSGFVGRDRPWLVVVVTSSTISLLGMSAWQGWAILPRVQYQMIAAIDGVSMFWVYIAIPLGLTLSIFVVLVEALKQIQRHFQSSSAEASR